MRKGTAAERLINKDVSAVTLKQQLPDSLTQHMTQYELLLSSMSHTNIYNMPREYWILIGCKGRGGKYLLSGVAAHKSHKPKD